VTQMAHGFGCPGYNQVAMLEAVKSSPLFHARMRDHLLYSGEELAMLPQFGLPPSVIYSGLDTVVNKDPLKPAYKIDEQRLVNMVYTVQANDAAHGSKRDISFFFGGQINHEHLGYDCRRQLFYDMPSMPQRTLIVSSDEDIAQARRGNVSLPNCSTLMGHDTVDDTVDFGAVFNATSNAVIGCKGRYDPTILANTEFIISPRGDVPSSPRLYEAAANGAIPVFLSDHHLQTATPFQCVVPYDYMTVSVAESDCMKDCGAAIRQATAKLGEAERAQMRLLLHHFKRDLLWTVNDSRVVDNVLLDALQRQRYYGGRYHGVSGCPFADRMERPYITDPSGADKDWHIDP